MKICINDCTSDKVNAMNTPSSPLTRLLDDYVDKFGEDSLDDQFKKHILAALPDEDDPKVLGQIAADVWDKYSCVDVELVISILRRWSAIEPDSADAKRTLGSYMLAHGPDWDDEGKALLEVK